MKLVIIYSFTFSSEPLVFGGTQKENVYSALFPIQRKEKLLELGHNNDTQRLKFRPSYKVIKWLQSLHLAILQI